MTALVVNGRLRCVLVVLEESRFHDGRMAMTPHHHEPCTTIRFNGLWC